MEERRRQRRQESEYKMNKSVNRLALLAMTWPIVFLATDVNRNDADFFCIRTHFMYIHSVSDKFFFSVVAATILLMQANA